MPHVSTINQYPPEQSYVRWGAVGSLGIHFLVAGAVLLVAFLAHVKTLEELMKESGSIATNGPAPEEPMEVVLQPDDVPPPPPSVNPEFVRQIETPKPVVVAPPPIVVKKTVAQVKPKYTAPAAKGDGQTNTVSRLVVGSSEFPQPPYPVEAEMQHQTGSVNVSIQFDGSGSVTDVQVLDSTGASIFISNTRSWIRSHWRNASFAGQSVSVPITYHLPGT